VKNHVARQFYCSQSFFTLQMAKRCEILLLLRADKRDKSNKPYDFLSPMANLVSCGSTSGVLSISVSFSLVLLI
jgi:hypothetical protein